MKARTEKKTWKTRLPVSETRLALVQTWVTARPRSPEKKALRLETLDDYVPGVSKALTRRPYKFTDATNLATAIWRIHAQLKPASEYYEAAEQLWDTLGSELNSENLLPPATKLAHFQTLLTRWLFPPPGPLTDEELLELFSPYLRSVAETCSQLVTWGIRIEGDPTLRLAQVYAALETTSRRPPPGAGELARETPPLSAWEALFAPDARRVVIVGEPGSGKSTFFQYVTLCLADKLTAANRQESLLAGLEVPDPPAQLLVPLRIALGDFVNWLIREKRSGNSEAVADYLNDSLAGRSYQTAANALVELLQRGLALVLFDGLDEVPKDHLHSVKLAITQFADSRYRECRVAVTCRIESYKHAEYRVDKEAGFPSPHEIASLSPALRERFVRAWYRELEQKKSLKEGTGAAFASGLLAAIRDEQLEDIAGNPFFLTAMAAINGSGSPLPNNSAELMDQLVASVLTESRKQRPGPDGRSEKPELDRLLDQVAGGSQKRLEQLRTELRSHLQGVAYQARVQRTDAKIRMVDVDLLRSRLLLDDKVDKDWANQVLDTLRHRAGLLQSRDGQHFEFAYRFEEFLAACFLADDAAWESRSRQQDMATPDFAHRVVNHLQESRLDSRTVVKWAAGYNAHVAKGRGNQVRELVSMLSGGHAGPNDESLTNLELAADIAHDAGMKEWPDSMVYDARKVVRELLEKLERIRNDREKLHPISKRARASSAIGRLGDERPGVGIIESAPRRPAFRWCGAKGEVEAGKSTPWETAFPSLPVFKLGEPKDRKDRAYGSFMQFDCSRITKPFFISKYPVTVAQYQLFVEAKGYEREFADRESTHRLWTADGWRWLTENKVTRPEDYSLVCQTPNHPRVGVSWFEAWAYAAWLNTPEIRAHFAGDLGLPKDTVQIHLPTEAEREFAARWNKQEGEFDGRLYPWGDEGTVSELTERCNWDKTGIGSTGAVGLFPKGNADCGAADLSGNVWEWCQTKWINPDDNEALKQYNSGAYDEDDGDSARVLRGGSWASDPTGSLRSSYRYNFPPGGRDGRIGFRVVCVVVPTR